MRVGLPTLAWRGRAYSRLQWRHTPILSCPGTAARRAKDVTLRARLLLLILLAALPTIAIEA
jgi:hypothetical protein